MPYGGTICGFIINANTVISSESLGAEGGCFKFRIDLDGNLAGNDVRKQMKEFGGLDDYPNFKSVSLTFTVKNDFTPVSVAYSAEYEVKKAFDMTCRQNYVNTYLKTGEEITIPLRDAFILALEK